MSAGIYQIKNDINGKIYVGKAKNLATRWKQHKDELAKGTHVNKYLQMDYDEMGIEAFTYSILEKVPDCPDLDKILFQKEREWGEKLNALGENGYNITNFYQGNEDKCREAMKRGTIGICSLRIIAYICYHMPYECVPLYLHLSNGAQYEGTSGVEAEDDGLAIFDIKTLALLINTTQKEVIKLLKIMEKNRILVMYRNSENKEQFGFHMNGDGHFSKMKWEKVTKD